MKNKKGKTIKSEVRKVIILTMTENLPGYFYNPHSKLLFRSMSAAYPARLHVRLTDGVALV